jgi:hypothetical protein
MKVKIDKSNFEKTGSDWVTIELLGKQNIERIIDSEIGRRLNYRLGKVNEGVEEAKAFVTTCSKELEKVKDTLEQFRTELCQLQEICAVINRVKINLDKLEEISNKLKKMDEEFMIFRLRLLNQEKIDKKDDDKINIKPRKI